MKKTEVKERDNAETLKKICPICGLKLAGASRDSSRLGFQLASKRCSCPAEQSFADGKMSAKLRKIKQDDSSAIFARTIPPDGGPEGNTIDLAADAIIGGVYRIVKLIGSGGMGEVYLARHETLGKKCALKVIPPDQVTDIGWQRFQLEAKAVARLDHINLVRVTDLGIHDGCLPYYAMDYVEGSNLAEILADQGPLPLQSAVEIFMQVCDGVECAHRNGILHRDLKPANIMLLASKSGKSQAKVLDFGLAKLTKHDRAKQSLTAMGDIFGSPYYMSPEQCNGDDLDNRSDIYSLGCTIFECLTGQTPFTGNLAAAVIFSHLESPPPSLASIAGPDKFPASIEAVVAKLLRKSPADRYQNLSQLKSDLQLIAEGKDVIPTDLRRGEKTGAGKQRQARYELEAGQAGHAGQDGRTGSAIHDGQDSTAAPARLSRKKKVFGLCAGLASTALLCGGIYFGTKHQKDEASKNLLARTGDNLSARGSVSMFDSVIERPQELDTLLDYDVDSFDSDWRQLSDKVFQYKHNPQTATTPFKVKTKLSGFQFPKDFYIAAMRIGAGKPFNASGFVPVPPDAPVFIYLSNTTQDWPEILDKFGPEDLTGLELGTKRADQVIERISHWKKLTELSFFNDLTKALPGFEFRFDESSLKKTDLQLVDKLGGLQSLGLCGPSVSGSSITNMQLLNTIHTLKLKRVADIGALLAVLPSKDNLKEIWLIGQDTTDDQLIPLTRMKNLESLRIRRSKLTPASQMYFAQMPALKHLWLDRDWTLQEKAEFKKRLPFCQFEAAVDRTFWTMFPGKKEHL